MRARPKHSSVRIAVGALVVTRISSERPNEHNKAWMGVSRHTEKWEGSPGQEQRHARRANLFGLDSPLVEPARSESVVLLFERN